MSPKGRILASLGTYSSLFSRLCVHTFNHREVKPNRRLIENQEFERMNKDCDVTNLGSLDFKNFPSMFKCLLENTDFKKLNIRGWQKDGVIPYTESPHLAVS